MDLKPTKNRRKPDWISKAAAKLHNVTPRYVNDVRNGDAEHEGIMTTVMDLIEGHKRLLEEVGKLVPFELTATTPKRKPLKYGDLK